MASKKSASTEVSPSVFHKKFCGPIATKVLDVIHGLSLLAVFAAAIYNTVKTVQGKATIKVMIPIYITTLIATLIKIPSQICAGGHKLGGWLTVIGSIVTVIITTILIGFLLFDPVYANDHAEDVCIIDTATKKKYCMQLDTSSFMDHECTDDSKCRCEPGLEEEEERGSFSEPKVPIPADHLYRGTFNPGHWSIFTA